MVNTRAADYTRTGNGWITSLANKLSFLSIIPGVGFVTGGMIAFDGILSAVGWGLRGKFASAATALGTSTVAGVTHVLPYYWAANMVSGVTTGRSLQSHTRALTEAGTSMVTRPLGIQPTVLRSYYAGVGGVGAAGMAAPKRDGFLAAEANRRGQSVDDAWSRVNSNQGDHVAALQSSAQGGAMGRG